MKQGKSITELVREVDRQAEAIRDYETPANRITVDTIGGAEELGLEGYGTFRIRETAHGHLAELAGIPKAYYDRMRAEAPAPLCKLRQPLARARREPRLVRTAEGAAHASSRGNSAPSITPVSCR